jgi:hypothetical protein
LPSELGQLPNVTDDGDANDATVVALLSLGLYLSEFSFQIFQERRGFLRFVGEQPVSGGAESAHDRSRHRNINMLSLMLFCPGRKSLLKSWATS